MPGENGRMDPAGNISQLLERMSDLLPGGVQLLRHFGLAGHALLEQAEPERKGDQPLLSSVVEVPLEPLSLLLPGLDYSRARALQLFDPRA
jgi:hypothetical protein